MNNDNSLVINDELHINLSDRSIMNIGNKTLIKLRPKPFRVLLYLYTHRGRCVSKDELFSECWNGAVVSDQSLTNTISTLRKALNTVEVNNIKLTTVSKAGYLLENTSKYEQVDIQIAHEAETEDFVETKIRKLHLSKEADKSNDILLYSNYDKFSYLKKLVMLILALTSISLIIGYYNTNIIENNMNQNLVSTEYISYNLVDYTGTLDLKNMEEQVRSKNYKDCKAKHIDITVKNNNNDFYATDFSITYKNRSHNYLQLYKIKKDTPEIRIVQLSRILSLCKLSF
ncbi:transcriptional regulator [Vibrio tasmaniensis 1F-187]|uniref:winged helix-turn-helix domain-containing protein n=1 Tax=unclassified Vibrio TaxID=2614977 RepID=UPI0002D977DD